MRCLFPNFSAVLVNVDKTCPKRQKKRINSLDFIAQVLVFYGTLRYNIINYYDGVGWLSSLRGCERPYRCLGVKQ